MSVEPATLPELSSSWAVGSVDVRQLTPSEIFDSPSQALFEELLKPSNSDYVVVDMGEGHEWLNSRLYFVRASSWGTETYSCFYFSGDSR